MAGSLRYFEYMDDLNNKYAFKIDESNAKATAYNLADQELGRLFLPSSGTFPNRSPAGFKMRSLSMISFDGVNQRLRFWCGRKGIFNQLAYGGGYIVLPTGKIFLMLRCHNEEYPLVPQFDIDTGLNDGGFLSERQVANG